MQDGQAERRGLSVSASPASGQPRASCKSGMGLRAPGADPVPGFPAQCACSLRQVPQGPLQATALWTVSVGAGAL